MNRYRADSCGGAARGQLQNTSTEGTEEHRTIAATSNVADKQISVSICAHLRMNRLLEPREKVRSKHDSSREFENRITLTTDFTDGTDEPKSESVIRDIRVIRVIRVIRGQDPVAPSTVGFGRKLDEAWTQALPVLRPKISRISTSS